MAKLSISVLVFICVLSIGYSNVLSEEVTNDVDEYSNIVLPPQAKSIGSIPDTEDLNQVGSDLPLLSRQKRGLGRRLKKLGRSADRSFRKVRDSALPAAGAAIGNRVGSG